MADHSDDPPITRIGEGERRLAAIAFTDVVGYSGVVHRDEKLGQRMLKRQAAVVRAVLPRFGGREVRLTGDGFLLEFRSALSAVQALAMIQTRLATDDQASACPVTLRASVHLGDVDHVAGDVYGDGVNLSARLMPLSPEGGIAISATVLMQVRQQLDLSFRSIGTPPLKNIAAPLEVFVADPPGVHALGRALESEPPPVVTSRKVAVPSGPSWIKPVAIGGIALLAIGLAMGVGMGLRKDRLGPPPPPPPVPATGRAAVTRTPAVAVLPFRNASGDSADEYFSDGLSEELINSLGRVDHLKVIGRLSSFQFKNTQDPPRTIGEKLGVEYLVDGSVRKAAERVRIGIALVRADDGSNLWTNTYDRDLKDIFGVQTEIASSVTGELQRRLALPSAPASSGLPETAQPPSGNVEAYQALLEGNFYVKRNTSPDLVKALGFYEKAIALDPRYAVAQARCAYIGFRYVAEYLQRDREDAVRRLARARAQSAEALELDPDLAAAHLARAYDLNLLTQQIAEAEREYRLASELAPHDPEILGEYGSFLFERGKLAPALGAFDRAVVLDPLSREAHLRRGRLLSMTPRLDEALAEVLRARDLEPRAAVSNTELAVVSLRRGDNAGAVAYARQEIDPFWRTWGLALSLFASGDRKGADAELAKMLRDNPDDAPYQIAETYAFRKDPDSAFRWLDRAREVKDPGTTQLFASRFLLAYRDDPRFAAFARKIGLDPANAPVLGAELAPAR